MTYFNTCPNCGANLDPGEKCDCKNKVEMIGVDLANGSDFTGEKVIVIPGKRKNQDPVVFKCRDCGCVFTACENDIFEFEAQLGFSIHSECPHEWCKGLGFKVRENDIKG